MDFKEMEYGQDSFGVLLEAVAGSFEQGNEPSGSIRREISSL
jgi:hypothetical protein